MKGSGGGVLDIVEGADTLLKIDVVRFDQLSIKDKFRENILKFKKVLFKKGSEYMDKEFWKDSFDSLGNALERLKEVLNSQEKHVSFWKDAVIQRFEFCFDLYWKTLRKFMAFENVDVETQFPREILQKAFQHGLINDEEVWLQMLKDRNRTFHMYKEEDANEIFEDIQGAYCTVMQRTYEGLKKRFYG